MESPQWQKIVFRITDDWKVTHSVPFMDWMHANFGNKNTWLRS